MENKIYWHLPGFSVFRDLNLTIIDLMKEYPNSFRDGYRVGSVYGTFPGAIWNGGRTALGFCSKNEIERTLKLYNGKHVPLRFTWTNALLQEKHVYDTYCNMIMRLADNGMNQVLVNTQVLEDYLKEHYPNFKYISSTTKRITDPELLMKEFEKDYFMVVLDYDLNHKEEVLERLRPYGDRVEILVDEICFPDCPKRVDHYRDEALRQLEFEVCKPYNCPNKQERKSFEDCKKRPAFISKEELAEYIDKGFRNFKLVGRGLPQTLVMDSYLYYLVKEEDQDFIKNQIQKRLAALAEERARLRARR